MQAKVKLQGIRRLRPAVVAILAGLGGMVANWALGAPSVPPDAAKQNERLGRGVNIIGYDPLWQSRQKARFQDRHFRLIKEAGFQHVRINLHPFRGRHMDKDGKLSDAWLATLDWAVDQALATGLLVVLDFHEFNAMGEDPLGHKDRMIAFWRQVAQRYKDRPSEVLFEILNEPNKKLTPELWNGLLREALAVIRRTNPRRTVVVGPGMWNNINALAKLALPADDPNIIVTVHYYSPFEFTHQGAPWAGRKDKVGIPWNGTPQERDAIIRDFQKAQAWANEHQRPLYLGEFGAYDKADMASRVRWTSFVAREAERLGWSWAYWQFDGNFIVFDMKTQQWVEPIRDALIPTRKAGPAPSLRD